MKDHKSKCICVDCISLDAMDEDIFKDLYPKEDRTCASCGFFSGENVYCSKKCAHLNVQNNGLNKRIINALISHGWSLKKIREKFGISNSKLKKLRELS